jgi:hypothetical protein
MLPNFLIVGAQKAGTTTLAKMLEQHPDVCFSQPRETTFFYEDTLFTQGPAYYERTFFGSWDGQKATGEKTPEYLYLPEVPSRIALTLGHDVRIVITLRSPAARAYSHYRHGFQMLRESLPFADALAAEPERIERDRFSRLAFSYLDRGRYAAQVRRYLDVFDPGCILFFVFEEDIIDYQEQAARRLFGFLGVDSSVPVELPISLGRPRLPYVDFIDVDTEIRSREGPIEAPAGSVVYRFAGGRVEIVRRPSRAQAAYAEAFLRNMPRKTELPKETEREINRRLADDIAETAHLIGRDLPWPR